MEGGQTKDHKVDLPPQKASSRISFDIEFNVYTGYTSMQLLAAIQQHVSSTCDDIGQECTPETYPLRIIFMGMLTDKLHRNDGANAANAQRPGDVAAHFRPGYCVVVGPESKWKCDKWPTEKSTMEFNGRVQSFTVAPTRTVKFAL